MQTSARKAPMNLGAIWNMCFGFLGIQIGFELQLTNTSRIFQTLGAEATILPILWIAAPLTGLIVQPIVGYFSDKTWTPLGRRRPYFLVGAILATLTLLAMPNAGLLWIAVGVLWIKDAALNITMEPFRAFVGDNLPDEQRSTGYALQSFFIGAGAVGAALLPWVFTNVFGIANTTEDGGIPPSVHAAYYVGAACLFVAVMWTVFRSREYSPEQLEAFEEARRKVLGDGVIDRPDAPTSGKVYVRNGLIWIVAGGLFAGLIAFLRMTDAGRAEDARLFEEAWQLYVLAGLVSAYGVLQIIVGAMAHDDNAHGTSTRSGVSEIIEDLYRMPKTMRQLAVVQFFSWFGLFAMWIFGVTALAEHHFGAPLDLVTGGVDANSQEYQDAGDWWGVISAVRNGTAALGALAIIWLAQKMDQRRLHSMNLLIGAAGLASLYVIRDPNWLPVSMILVGIAWASIVSVPYSILSSAVPARKMGVYMGIFNIFIVVPQVLAATVLGLILSTAFDDHAIYMFFVAAGSFTVAAIATFFVRDAVAERRDALAAAAE